MLNIALTITAAPELLTTLNKIADMFVNTGVKEQTQKETVPSNNVKPAVQAPASIQQPLPAAPVSTPTQGQQPIQAQQATPISVPVAPTTPQTPVAPAATIPTATQTYSMEQLAVAATQLVDAGRRTELVALLSNFGVQALTALPKEQYGAFATQLRAMGAKI